MTGDMNWWLLAGLILLAWFWQNVVHEGSHLLVGWLHEGRRPLKFIPWPHRYQGRWYWSRYASGPATKSQDEAPRHVAPVLAVVFQVALVLIVSPAVVLFGASWYVAPFLVCPLVDMGVWCWGYWARRPGTDGDRWRRTCGF